MATADREALSFTDGSMAQVDVTIAPGATLEDVQASLKQACIDATLAFTGMMA
jgi:hypothetical protein